MKEYLEIAPDSHVYIKIPSRLCRSLYINNNILIEKDISSCNNLTFLDRRNLDKIAIWQFNSKLIFDDSELTKVLKEFRE